MSDTLYDINFDILGELSDNKKFKLSGIDASKINTLDEVSNDTIIGKLVILLIIIERMDELEILEMISTNLKNVPKFTNIKTEELLNQIRIRA